MVQAFSQGAGGAGTTQPHTHASSKLSDSLAGQQVSELLCADEAELAVPGAKSDLTLAAARVLASAGAAMRAAGPADKVAARTEQLQPLLLRLCRSGAPKAAKAAVRRASAQG